MQRVGHFLHDPPRLHPVDSQQPGQLAFREVPFLVGTYSQELVLDRKLLVSVRVRRQPQLFLGFSDLESAVTQTVPGAAREKPQLLKP